MNKTLTVGSAQHRLWIMARRMQQVPFYLLTRQGRLFGRLLLLCSLVLSCYLVYSLLFVESLPPGETSAGQQKISTEQVRAIEAWLQERTEIQRQGLTIPSTDAWAL